MFRKNRNHIERWNKRRKYNTNGRLHHILVLLGWVHSPTFEFTLTDDEERVGWWSAGEKPITYEDASNALNELIENTKRHYNPTQYYFLGYMGQYEAGISDKMVIKFFKNSPNVVLVDRKGRQWRQGKRVKDIERIK